MRETFTKRSRRDRLIKDGNVLAILTQQQLIVRRRWFTVKTAGLRRERATASNGHNVVIILQLAIPRINRHDARQEPEASEGSRTGYSLLRPRAAAAVSGCAWESSTRPASCNTH